MQCDEIEEICNTAINEAKSLINRTRINDDLFEKLFDFHDNEINHPIGSKDITTEQSPETVIEDIVRDMIERALGIDRTILISKPVKRADFGGIKVHKEPDIGIEPENMRSEKGILIEIEPLGKNLIKNKKHGVTQAKLWFQLPNLGTYYEAIATNLVHWYLIRRNREGLGTYHKKFNTPKQAIEYIYNQYNGVDRLSFEEEKEFEENINRFYDDFADCMKKIALNNERTNPYRIIHANVSEEERVRFFRTLFFRILFIKILNSWKIIRRDPIGEYVLETSKDAYYFRLRKVFFKVFNAPEESREEEVDVPILKEIPYLNGGLFRKTDIENEHSEIAVTGSAIEYIWEKLDKYHYIPHSESEDDDKKYISPKALGHIFEKTIDASGGDRKGSGSYYTPKSITNYISSDSIEMCIIDKVNRFIKNYIREKEDCGERPIIREEITDLDYYYNLNAEASNIITRKILKILSTIKLCDNACGSGAFLDSSSEKLEKLYRKMYRYLGKRDLYMHDTQSREHDPENGIFRDIYSLRRHIVVNNIHGVDIQEESVEIAKLRLWLWIINPYDSYTHSVMKVAVEPLPNIDYNILVGNSLIGFTSISEVVEEIQSSGLDAFMGNYDIIENVIRLKREYKNTSDPDRAVELRKEINEKSATFYKKLNKLYIKQKLSDISITIPNILSLEEAKNLYSHYTIIKFKIDFKENISSDITTPLFKEIKGVTGYTREGTTSSCWSNKKASSLRNLKIIYEELKDESDLIIELEREISVDDLEEMKIFHWGFEFYDVFQEEDD